MNRLTRSLFFLVMAFLYIPMVVVVLFSFNHSLHSLIWHGWTWQWYSKLWHDALLAKVTWHSLCLGFSAAFISTVLGAVVSYSLYRYRFFGRRLISGLLIVLIVIPDLVMAIALMILFRSAHVSFGFVTLFLAHVSFCLPFSVMVISNRLSDLNPQLLLAAEDLGASLWQQWWWVMIPAMRSALLVSALLSFMLSFDDVVISFFVSGPNYVTLPLHVYAMAKLGANPEINALCSLLLLLTVAVVLISQRLLGKKT